ncbi:hypothetical protein BH11MYX3_BH11MYX3_47470 [soil metagenome]
MLFLLFRGILLGIHTYVWWRLVYQAHLPRRWFIGLTALIVFLFLSGPITTASRNVWPSISATFGWISLPWMALCGLTFVALVFLDVSTLFVRTGRRIARGAAPPTSPDRRAFLSRITGGAAMAMGTTSAARCMVSARG